MLMASRKIAGPRGFFRLVLGCIELYWPVLSCIGLYWTYESLVIVSTYVPLYRPTNSQAVET